MTEILFNKERFERSKTHLGNPYRLLKLFEKAKKGEEIVFVAIGGSITMGCNASSEKNRYSYIVKTWFEKTFNAKVKLINAGIGATGSLIGIHRIDRDVLCHDPDFVLVEFSVNDAKDSDDVVEFYDNILNKLLNYKTAPAVLCLATMSKMGTNAQNSHLKVAKHYNVPFLSYRDSVWCEVEAGELEWSVLSNDDVHPIDAGQRLCADLVTAYLEEISSQDMTTLSDSPCSAPLVSQYYQNAQTFHAGQIEPKSYGCFKIKENIRINELTSAFIAEENGDPLVFELENCKSIFLEYERSHKGDGGKGVVTVGEKTIEFDCDFTGGWGTYYTTVRIFKSDTPKTVTIKITPKLEEGKHVGIAGILMA